MPLPYHAGKSKLAKHLAKIVFNKVQENPSIKNYAEPFSGMARVGIKVMEDDKNKVFNKYYFYDVNPTISVLFNALKKGWLPKVEDTIPPYGGFTNIRADARQHLGYHSKLDFEWKLK